MHNSPESYSAAIHEDPNKHFLEVQNGVFTDLIKRDGVHNKRKFFAQNAYLFRHFAEHLPDDLKNSWDAANQDGASRLKLEEQYGLFYAKVNAYMGTQEPEVTQELIDAINDGDIELASYIFESTFGRQSTK